MLSPEDLTEEVIVRGIEESGRVNILHLDIERNNRLERATVDKRLIETTFGLQSPLNVPDMYPHIPFRGNMHIVGQHITQMVDVQTMEDTEEDNDNSQHFNYPQQQNAPQCRQALFQPPSPQPAAAQGSSAAATLQAPSPQPYGPRPSFPGAILQSPSPQPSARRASSAAATLQSPNPHRPTPPPSSAGTSLQASAPQRAPPPATFVPATLQASTPQRPTAQATFVPARLYARSPQPAGPRPSFVPPSLHALSAQGTAPRANFVPATLPTESNATNGLFHSGVSHALGAPPSNITPQNSPTRTHGQGLHVNQHVLQPCASTSSDENGNSQQCPQAIPMAMDIDDDDVFQCSQNTH